ncbi:NAD-dependent epimerase/dehydratase family protein [Rubellimicrobium roseum]|uniref:NAD-dependent epimerase/dehydratase family protein n=1 Tax=Rubellimicrobium roseum TaxID=687525 RepID=UPI003CCC71D2
MSARRRHIPRLSHGSCHDVRTPVSDWWRWLRGPEPHPSLHSPRRGGARADPEPRVSQGRRGARSIEGDVLATGLERVMTRSQWLIHAAADTGHGTREQAWVNLEGTRNIFGSARSIGARRALIISTESVLLAGRPLVDAAEDQPFPRRPAGSYCQTKAAAERMVLSFAGPDFEVVAIRPRFVWGRDDTTAMPNHVEAAWSGRMAWIDGGRYRISTTHIANLCEGVARALEGGRSGEIYFIAEEAPSSFGILCPSYWPCKGFRRRTGSSRDWSSAAWPRSVSYLPRSVVGGSLVLSAARSTPPWPSR